MSTGMDHVSIPGGAEPKQNFGTSGLSPMTRPRLTTRFLMAVVAWVERLNIEYSKVGNPPVYDLATFPWVKEIEAEWRTIRAELEKVLVRQDELPTFQDIATDVRTISTDSRWKTFFLIGFGAKLEK